jgi:hypothetical protein
MHLYGRFPLSIPKTVRARSDVTGEGFTVEEYDPVAEILMTGGEVCSELGLLVSILKV